ncbi:MAG TPA: hypothetical protein VJN70_01420 [Gemmatimonadaceae bacterium]|nr:hypothetical protein [Gemmatimonadaceae bacterium]
MATLPTRQELSERLRAFDSWQLPRFGIAIVLFLVAIFANLPLLRWLPQHGIPRQVIVVIMAAELSAMAGFLWYVRHRARAASLACPSCRRPFTDSRARRQALSVGRCPSCYAPLASDTVEPSYPGGRRSDGHIDHAKRRALLAQVKAMSHTASTTPLVTAAQFFDGNGDDGSIAANLIEHPGVRRFAELTSAIEARADVEAVLVGITDLMADGEGSWPYSDTLYVLTSAPPSAVRGWLAELAPDEVETGFAGGVAAPPLGPGMAPVRVWWD